MSDSTTSTEKIPYTLPATLSARFNAYLIDYIVLLPLLILVANFLEYSEGGWVLISSIVYWAYFSVCEGTWGQTLGKKLEGIEVRTVEFREIGVGRAAWRNLFKIVPIPLVQIISFLMIMFGRTRQGIHDVVANTFVLLEEFVFHPSEDKEKQISNAEHFPFKSYSEFRRALEEGKILGIGTDQSVARQWMTDGKRCPKFWRIIATLLQFAPWLIYLAFIVIVVMNGRWLLLLALPVFLVFFVLSLPSARGFGVIRTGGFWLLVAGFVYGLYVDSSTFTLLTATPLLVWGVLKYLHSKADNLLRRAAIEYEELLFLLWDGQHINMTTEGGVREWKDFYVLPNGKMVSRSNASDEN